MDNKKSNTGPGFLGFLCLFFIALKLTGHINWPWIWVLSPIWIYLAVLLMIVVIVVAVELYNRGS